MTCKKATLIGFALMILAFAERGQEPSVTAVPAEPHEVQVTAKKYEFNPSVITVKKGDHIKLLITALDRDHGFKLEAFKINQKLKKGAPATIEFVADKAGTFPFQCSDFCGLGHGRMKGKLVVEESPNP